MELIEPGNWDYGQNTAVPEFDDTIPGSLPAPRRAGAPLPGGKIARLRIWNDRLVITAPDFIHRQVGGYPKPFSPPVLTDEERADRSRRASSENAQVLVLPRSRRAGR